MMRVSRSWSAVATGSFVDMQISSCSTFLNIAAYRRPMISALVMLVIGMASAAMGAAGMMGGGAPCVRFRLVLFFGSAAGLASFRKTGLRAAFRLIAFAG